MVVESLRRDARHRRQAVPQAMREHVAVDVARAGRSEERNGRARIGAAYRLTQVRRNVEVVDRRVTDSGGGIEERPQAHRVELEVAFLMPTRQIVFITNRERGR